MRLISSFLVGLALTAALWTSGPAVVFADDLPTGQGWCDPAQVFVPGTSLGPVRIGMSLDAVPHWYGPPRSVENRRLQGRQWTHMLFTGLDVLARDNTVVALNLPQVSSIPAPTNCGTVTARPFNLPVGYVRQTYGPPSLSLITNGLQYWLYNALGLLLTVPVGGNFVQGLTVYPVGQYCDLQPVFVSFGRFFAVNAVECRTAGDHEGPSR